MTNPTPSHLDYAEEAEAAQRADAWPQAAALWRRASQVLRATAPHTTDTFDLHAKYQAAADQCDHKAHVDMVLEHIAKTTLDIPMLRTRKSGGHGLRRHHSGDHHQGRGVPIPTRREARHLSGHLHARAEARTLRQQGVGR